MKKIANRRSLTLLLLGQLCLFGCHYGPEIEEVQKTIQAKLDRYFPKGLFKITQMKRRGHYSYSIDGKSGTRELLYFNAEIKFLKDFKLSNWDQLNVGSLVSILGAMPKGVQGVNPRGNKRGDLLQVFGSSAFAHKDHKWQPVAFVSTDKQEANIRVAEKEALPYRRNLERLAKVGTRFQAMKNKTAVKFLDEKLAEAVAAAERQLGRIENALTIATGNPSGEYHHQGQGLERILKRAGFKAQVFPTTGSIENCKLVNKGEVLFGYSQNDIAHMAYNGSDLLLGQLPLKHLRALCSLYSEAVQIVTLKSSSIHSIQDLRKKRVNIGPPGSGTRLNALEIMEAEGITLQDLAETRSTDIEEATRDLKQKRIDAFFITHALPTPLLHTLAEEVPLRLVPLNKSTVDHLRISYPFIAPMEIPANVYPGITTPCKSVKVTAMLVTHDQTPEEKVRALLSQLFDNVKALSEGSLQAYYISKDHALEGLSLPLHPGAKAYFKKDREPSRTLGLSARQTP